MTTTRLNIRSPVKTLAFTAADSIFSQSFDRVRVHYAKGVLVIANALSSAPIVEIDTNRAGNVDVTVDTLNMPHVDVSAEKKAREALATARGTKRTSKAGSEQPVAKKRKPQTIAPRMHDMATVDAGHGGV